MSCARRLAPLAMVVLTVVVSFVAAPRAEAQSCGDLGGTYCSPNGWCPPGSENLGDTGDPCTPCCREAPQDGPSCGELGGDECSKTGSCPAGYRSLGGTWDCHPCCQALPTCGERGGDECGHGSCPYGYDSIGDSLDCHPCCKATLASCGDLGGDTCSHSGTCPQGYQNLGTSRDCQPCCLKGPSCTDRGGNDCRQGGIACHQGDQNLGATWDCNPCCKLGPTCGDLGGTECSLSGSCSPGNRSLGISRDCNPCCGPVNPGGTDDAQVVSTSLPSSLTCGATFEASVTMKNTGSTTWTAGAGYKLGTVGDSDPFYPVTRVYLPDGVSVAPGASYTFSMTLSAPSGGGALTTDWQMVHEGKSWFGGVASRVVTVTCAQSGDHADRVSDSLPASMLCATASTVSVTLRNTGSTRWTAAAGYELASTSGNDVFFPAARVGLARDVDSGQDYTFTMTLNAPAIAGVYPSRWQMRHGSTWFGPLLGGDVTVACQGQGDNAWVTNIDLPFAMQCGQTYSGSVTMMNVGSGDWRRIPGGVGERQTYKLGAVGNSDPFTTATRVGLGGAVVPPGGSFTFPLTLTAPGTDGTYTTDWQMVYVDVGADVWFGNQAVRTVRVACQDVDDAAREAATLPDTLAAGQEFAASVTMRNIGTTTWRSGQGYRLGAVGDSDPFASFTRVELPKDVGPGDKVTFTFTLTGTGQPGHTDWRMVHDGVAWFGDTAGKDVSGSSTGSTEVQVCPWVSAKADNTGGSSATAVFRACITGTPVGGSLLVPVGRYLIDGELEIAKPMTFGTAPPPDASTWATTTCAANTCAVLLAAPGLDSPGDLLYVHDTSGVVLDHLVLDGNRDARKARTGAGAAAVKCANREKNAPNARVLQCDDCQFVYSVTQNALCASGLMWRGTHAIVHDSAFKNNGDFGLDASGVRVNNEMWADGLTLLWSDRAQVTSNTFDSNSDVDLILGGGQNQRVSNNSITQNGQWAFAGLMLDNFGNSQPGDFTDTVVGGDTDAEGNTIRCNNKCQFGIQLGPHPWYIFERRNDELQCSLPVRNIVGGKVTHNTVSGALQGLNIDGAGTQGNQIEVHDNHVSGSAAGSASFFNCNAQRSTSDYNYFLVPQQGGPPNGDSWVDTKGIATTSPVTRNSFHPCDDARACNRPPVARPGSRYDGTAMQAVALDGSASSDPDGFITNYAWTFGDGESQSGSTLSRTTHVYRTAGTFTVQLTVTDDLGATATATATAVIAANQAPTVSLATAGTCGAGCTVTFTSTASDPEGGPVTRAWSGCASGSTTAATCTRPTAGPVAATVTVADADGQTTAASASVSTYAASYSTGAWGTCEGTAAYTCTSASATGCSRPGTRTRPVTETSWTLNSAAAATPPAGSQSCTQTAQGYVASWSVGAWGGCDPSCGTGTRYRTVTATSFKSTAPAAARPADSETCYNSPCKLNCGDYGLYSRRRDCEAEWPFCDVRYRDDGIGGLLMCWMGYY